MRTFTVFGHVLADKLPLHTTTIGDAWIKYRPSSPRTGGGPQAQHVSFETGVNYESIVPAHMLIESNWQIGFKGILAADSNAAIEIARTTRVPQFQAAYHFATGEMASVVVSGFVDEKTQEEISVWSYAAAFSYAEPCSLSQDKLERANEVSGILQQDSSASRAATLLSQAEWRLTASGGIVAFQAAAVLDSAQAIEKIAQEVNKRSPAEPLRAANDTTVQSHLSRLKEAIENDSAVEKQLSIIKKLSQRAYEVERMSTVAMLKHSMELLGLGDRDAELAKSLWKLRSTKLAHPGTLPEDLSREAVRSIALGRRFLNAYLAYLLNIFAGD